MKATKHGTPATTGPEMRRLFEVLEAMEPGLEQEAHRACVLAEINDLEARARAGDSSALPALRVMLEWRPAMAEQFASSSHCIRQMAKTAAGQDVWVEERYRAETRAKAAELAGLDPTPLVKLLAERTALAWFDANDLDGYVHSTRQSERHGYIDRLRSQATRRLVQAAKALAQVQRLAVPALNVGAIIGHADTVNAAVVNGAQDQGG